MYLLRGWIGDRSTTFPTDPTTLPIAYLVVFAAIYAAGFGLVTLGHRLGRGRRDRRAAQVGRTADPVPAG